MINKRRIIFPELKKLDFEISSVIEDGINYSIYHNSSKGLTIWSLLSEEFRKITITPFGNLLISRKIGPAIIYYDYLNDIDIWYEFGEIHREDGPAYCDHRQKTYRWYQKGQIHREDGPAIISNDRYKYYYLNDLEFNSEEEYFKALPIEKQKNYIFNLGGLI